MKRVLLLTFSSLVIMIATSFVSLRKSSKCNNTTLLVLKNPMNSDSFSMFSIEEIGDVLIGHNLDEYPVMDGIYRIEGTSNNKLYHRNILIMSK